MTHSTFLAEWSLEDRPIKRFGNELKETCVEITLWEDLAVCDESPKAIPVFAQFARGKLVTLGVLLVVVSSISMTIKAKCNGILQ